MSAPGKIPAAAWMGLLGLLLQVTSGCGDSNDPGGGGDLVSQQIGPEGGTVRSSDGQLTLIFPAGAVTQTQTITIEPLATNQVGSEFAAFAVDRAYGLGPDGLAFQRPITVSVPSDQQVEQPDGSLKVSMGLLLTSVGGQARGLEGMRVEPVESGLAVRGELSHFSPLVATTPLITFTVAGVPTELAINDRFNAAISLRAEVVEAEAVVYSDASVLPVRPLEPAEDVPLEQSAPNHFTGTLAYTCQEAGTGRYVATVQVTPGEGSPASEVLRGLDLSQLVQREVRCIAAGQRTLTVTKTGSGTGTVTSSPEGIDCGDGPEACREPYASGITVGLTATPDAGSHFVTWSGACSGTGNQVPVLMDADKTCTAQFDRNPILTVTKSGSGTGTVTSIPPGISCGEGTEACTEQYPLAENVGLTASPDAGSRFVVWSGACSGTNVLSVVVADADKTCNAQFDREATVIDRVGSLNLNHGLEAAALPLATSGPANAAKLLTLGPGSSGTLDVIDFTNPAAPQFNPGAAQSCAGAHTVFFADFFGAQNPIWFALRETPPSTCLGEVPLGEPEVFDLSAPPAEGVAIPNSHDIAIGLRFPQEAVLQLSHFGQTPSPSEGIRLAQGACPDGIAATSQKVFVVLTGSPGGTPDVGCTVNGLAVVDLASKQVNLFPIADIPQDITLTPDGRTAHISSTSGFRWVFDPQLGVAQRVSDNNFGPVFSMRPLDNRALAVANGNTNRLHVLDVASGSEIANVPSGGVGPIQVLLAQDGETVIVPHSDGKVVFFEYTPY